MSTTATFEGVTYTLENSYIVTYAQLAGVLERLINSVYNFVTFIYMDGSTTNMVIYNIATTQSVTIANSSGSVSVPDDGTPTDISALSLSVNAIDRSGGPQGPQGEDTAGPQGPQGPKGIVDITPGRPGEPGKSYRIEYVIGENGSIVSYRILSIFE